MRSIANLLRGAATISIVVWSIASTLALAQLGHALPATPQAAANCQPSWIPTFGPPPGTDVFANTTLVYDDGSGPALYVGGYFNYAGGVTVNHIARWDGSRWSPLAGGVTGPANSHVRAMAVFDDGSGPALYVAGLFTAASGVPANNIARWNGQSWSALGAGVTASSGSALVSALAEYNDGTSRALYVAGLFTTAGGVAANNIARWDGAQWSALGGGIGASYESASSLCVYNDGGGPKLYAGGYFTLAGGAACNYIAKWNGSMWSSVAGGTDGRVMSMRLFNDGNGTALYAGGAFSTAGGVSARSVAKLTGTSWSPLGTGVNGFVSSLTAFDDGAGPALHASTVESVSGALTTSVRKWNGSSWSTLGSGTQGFVNQSSINSLAVFDDGAGASLYAAGEFVTADGIEVQNVAKWSGSTWWPLPHGVNGPIEALVAFDDGSGHALYAGGFFSEIAGFSAKDIAKWNGFEWSSLGTGAGGQSLDYVTSLAAFDDGGGLALYAGGSFLKMGGTTVHNVAKWNGSSWSALAGGVDGPVFALQVFDDGNGPKLYAGGAFSNAGAGAAQSIAAWNGTAWTSVGSWVSASPTVYALEVFDDGSGPALFAGGSFQTVGSPLADNVAQWNGFTWNFLGSGVVAGMLVHGVNNTVSALRVFDDGTGSALYVGGKFAIACGVLANRIAKWDGSNWSALASGVTSAAFGNPGRVAALSVFDDSGGSKLYAGGLFDQAGGAPAANLACWDGASWSTLGSGLDSTVLSLCTFDDSSGPALFVGGAFHRAFDSGDWHLAKWGCPFVSSGSTYCTSGTSSNGCVSAMSSSGLASATSTSAFTISVTGVDASRSGLLLYGIHGPLASPWGFNGTSRLCVKAPQQRMGLQNSGGTPGACDGSLSEDWNAYISAHSSSLGSPFTGGETVWAQAWFRDPLAVKNSALSNGLVFSVAP